MCFFFSIHCLNVFLFQRHLIAHAKVPSLFLRNSKADLKRHRITEAVLCPLTVILLTFASLFEIACVCSVVVVCYSQFCVSFWVISHRCFLFCISLTLFVSQCGRQSVCFSVQPLCILLSLGLVPFSVMLFLFAVALHLFVDSL